MHETGETHHEDIVRAFFKYRAGDIGHLLAYVMDIARKASYELGRSLVVELPEANRVILVRILLFYLEQAVLDFKADNLEIGHRISTIQHGCIWLRDADV